MLEMPHVNILSKMDLVKGQVAKRDLKRFLTPDADLIDDDKSRITWGEEEEEENGKGGESSDPTATKNVMGGASFQKLNKAVAQLIDDFAMVSFLKLDAQDEDSIGGVLSYIDDAIQYHEAQEPREPKDDFVEMIESRMDN
jgi:GPN-loop GTPase